MLSSYLKLNVQLSMSTAMFPNLPGYFKMVLSFILQYQEKTIFVKKKKKKKKKNDVWKPGGRFSISLCPHCYVMYNLLSVTWRLSPLPKVWSALRNRAPVGRYAICKVHTKVFILVMPCMRCPSLGGDSKR